MTAYPLIPNVALDVAIEALCERHARQHAAYEHREVERSLFAGVHDTDAAVLRLQRERRELAGTEEAVRQFLAERRRRVDAGVYPDERGGAL